MPQKYSQNLVNTFVKGLVTEATEMTFPENTSSDELNCDLLKNGARRRRKAFAYEENYQLSSFTVNAGDFIHEDDWSNVSGLSGVEFLIVQVNAMLYFFDKSRQVTSAAQKSFSINLNSYTAGNSFDVANEAIQTASINGYLVVTSPAINPLKVKYTPTTDSISVEVITIKVRDFEFLDTTTDPQTNPTTITTNYKYDLYNMGWSSGNNGRTGNAFEYWDSQRTYFPPRSKSWWIGKNSSNEQEPSQYEKIDGGNTLAPNGHYILDFFSKNRSSASGITGITTVVETARFRATAPYAGRVWYAGLDSAENAGKIFFSKVIDKEGDFGKCYQEADPTSEDTAGVVDSDGGFLVIPDAANIRALFATGSMLLVFAQNGIWAIGGVDQIFKASAFYVKKISPFGLLTANALVDVSGAPIFWDISGIYTLTIDNLNESVQSISGSIKSLFDGISNDKKLQAKSVYDRVNKRVYWMYPDNDETVDHKCNNLLILDLDLQAWFPWRLEDTTGTTPYLLGGFTLSGLGATPTDFTILAGTDTVIKSTDTVVQTISVTSGNTGSDIKFICKTADNKLTMGDFTDRGFLDWDSANYSSFAETGFNFMGEATTKKNAPYVTSYLKRTEENFVVDGAGYTVDYPSSCLLTVKWDLSGDSSRWSEPTQVYRMVNYPVVNPDDLTFTYPYDTIVTRSKIRGKGRVMRMRWESEQGKDFYLVGWETLLAQNPRF